MKLSAFKYLTKVVKSVLLMQYVSMVQFTQNMANGELEKVIPFIYTPCHENSTILIYLSNKVTWPGAPKKLPMWEFFSATIMKYSFIKWVIFKQQYSR